MVDHQTYDTDLSDVEWNESLKERGLATVFETWSAFEKDRHTASLRIMSRIMAM